MGVQMILDSIARWWNGGPIEVPKTDLSSEVDQFLYHRGEALRLADKIGPKMAVHIADLTTSTNKLHSAATAQIPPKATP